MPANPGRIERLRKTTVPRLVGVDDRHAVDGATRRVLGGRVDGVVRPDDEGDVGGGHLRVGLVHLLQFVVGHVRLGQ